jgi:hypothetical protein
VGSLGETEEAELSQSLCHLGQQTAGRDRNDDAVGAAPAELFGGLEDERLGSFRVEGPEIDVYECPRLRCSELGAHAIGVVVVALELEQPARVDAGGGNLAGFEVAGDENDASHARRGRVSGNRVSEVAGRGACSRVEAKAARRREGNRDDPILERVGWVVQVQLQPQFLQPQLRGQPRRLPQGRPPSTDVDATVGVGREQRRVAPYGIGTGRYGLPSDRRSQPVVVEHRLEWTEALIAVVLGADGEPPSALATGKLFDSEGSIGARGQLRGLR